MKNIFRVFIFTCISFSNSLVAQSYVFISEYVEGSGNNKSIEIYNGTASTIDLSANSFELRFYFNGSATPTTTISLTGSVASGDVHVVSSSSAGTALLSLSDQISSATWFNGDDAVELRANGTTLDVIGQIGFDPGIEWGTGVTSTADNTLIRKSFINTGDTNPSDAFDPSVEWDGYVVDTFTDLGSHSGPLLPVELISFSAITKDGGVELAWKTATEVNNSGFEVERRVVGQTFLFDRSKGQAGMLVPQWEKIGFIEGNGTTNAPKEYSFTDNSVLSGTYSYRLKQIDRDGKFEYSQEVEVMISQMPQMFTLMQNYPNPFNPSTAITYSVPNTGKVSLSVYDMLGREVASLVNGVVEAGEHSIKFNASNLAGGVYFYTFRSGDFTDTKKLLLVK